MSGSGVTGVAEGFGPGSAWRDRLERARDLGLDHEVKALWRERDAAVQAEQFRANLEQRYAGLAGQDATFAASERELAAARESGDAAVVARLEADRAQRADAADFRVRMFADKRRLDRQIAEDMVKFNRVPEDLHVDGDAAVQRLRAKILELADERDLSAVTQRGELEAQLHERLVDLALPAVTRGPVVPEKSIVPQPAQSALGQLEEATAAGDVRAIVAAEQRISREWLERSQVGQGGAHDE